MIYPKSPRVSVGVKAQIQIFSFIHSDVHSAILVTLSSYVPDLTLSNLTEPQFSQKLWTLGLYYTTRGKYC